MQKEKENASYWEASLVESCCVVGLLAGEVVVVPSLQGLCGYLGKKQENIDQLFSVSYA